MEKYVLKYKILCYNQSIKFKAGGFMSKIKINITIKNPEANISKEVDAILQDEILKYKEEKDTSVKFSYKDKRLVRENNDLRMDYSFLEGQTTKDTILVKELNKNINVDIKTKNIKINENDIEIIFDVEENEFIYKVEVIK